MMVNSGRAARAMDDGASTTSWEAVDPAQDEADSDGLQMPSADMRLGPIPEDGGVQSNAAPYAASRAAPATQAARGLINHENEPASARRLRREQEKAQRKGRKGVRWGQLGGVHNAVNGQLPQHLSQLGAQENERSILIVDTRDQRVQSPFQGWLLDEILTNAQAHVNVLSDRQLVRSPNQGYHMNLFYMRTLDGTKLIVTGSMTSYESVPCGHWDSATGAVLSHKAFQPFRWPLMRNDSSTWVDFKLRLEGRLLLHLELRGYRSDSDMTVQMNYVSEEIYHMVGETLFVPTFAVTIFQGWRVVAVSWEVGGRIYACSSHGVVVALDFPLCHFELRLVSTSSADALGLDADRLEFRFLSAGDRIDVAASSAAVPPTWLVVSRVSGPTLIRNAHWCRDHHARIEGPDQTLQLSQLAMVHAHWTAAIEANTVEETGPRISAIAVESHSSNVHLTCESPLFRADRVIVKAEALALQAHDKEDEVPTELIAPVLGGPSVVPANMGTGRRMHALSGPEGAGQIIPQVAGDQPKMTEPGTAPQVSSLDSAALAPTRRSLEVRRSEGLDRATVTPQGFVAIVEQFRTAGSAASSQPCQQIEQQGSLDGSEMGSVEPSSGPQSFAPAAPRT